MEHRYEAKHPFYRGEIDPHKEYLIKHQCNTFNTDNTASEYTFPEPLRCGDHHHHHGEPCWHERPLPRPNIYTDKYHRPQEGHHRYYQKPLREPGMNDVENEYGYSSRNIAILNRVTERIGELTNALAYMNKPPGRGDRDLKQIQVLAPSAFRTDIVWEAIHNALTGLLEKDMMIADRIRDLLYGYNKPNPLPPLEPSDETLVPVDKFPPSEDPEEDKKEETIPEIGETERPPDGEI